MAVCDYVDQNGHLRTTYTDTRHRDASAVLGTRDPGSNQYGSGNRRHPYPDSYTEVRKDPNVRTEPMNDPPTVN